MRISVFAALISIFLFASCESYSPYPRPMGFHRINLPNPSQYTRFQNETCPFTFEYPDWGLISRNQPDSCWVDVAFEAPKAKWHISYRNTRAVRRTRNELFEEYRTLIYKHTKQADRILESPIESDKGYGMLFEVYGNVGTPAQFFFSDTTDTHVIMNSFYYQTALKNDSLYPISVYMKEEMMHMIGSLEWKK